MRVDTAAPASERPDVSTEDNSFPYIIPLSAILILAAILRLTFQTGYEGSDDVTYLVSAARVAAGVFTPSEYIGAIRFGLNLSVGALLAVLGNGEWVAYLMPLASSLAEIAVLFWFSHRFFGWRVASAAAFVLATVPLHVVAAGTVMPDPANGLMITTAMATFFVADRENRPWLFVVSGAAAGASFWLREASIIFLLAFALYVVVERRIRLRWFISAAAFSVVVGANLMFFHAISGDPFFVFKVLKTFTTDVWASEAAYSGQPFFYFSYLLADLRHTSLLGPLAMLGVMICAKRREAGIAAFWALALLAVFSFLPSSFDPLQFVRKQTNYMVMFLAPLALMAGYFVTRLPKPMGAAILITHAGLGVALAMLAVQSSTAFSTADRAAIRYLAANPGAPAIGSRDAASAATYFSILHSPDEPSVRIYRSGAIPGIIRSENGSFIAEQDLRFFQVGLPGDRANAPQQIQPPPCWNRRPDPPVKMEGWIYQVLSGAKSLLDTVGTYPMKDRIDRIWFQLLVPRRVQLFDVPAGCPVIYPAP